MASDGQFYTLKPINKWGFVEVRGIQLTTDVPEEAIRQIKQDIHKYRIMIFRDQGDVSGKRHVEISRWFGELDSTFYRHPASPDTDVFRVSNDEKHGCTGVGRTGWHIDGSFQQAPFDYSLYHIVHTPKKSATVFAPLNELISGLPSEKRSRWERLWMASDKRSGIIHPMLYPHHVTGQMTMCFHLGMTEAFVWDYGTAEERMTNWQETKQILKEIYQEFVKDNGAMQYAHKYSAGDFIISDNRAIGHEASADTQLPADRIGLRVMHRTTVKGSVPPSKKWHPPAEPEEQGQQRQEL